MGTTNNEQNDTENLKFSFSIFQKLLENSSRLTKMVWKEKKIMMIVLGFVVLVVSVVPFLRSGSYGLLINELVRAGQGSSPSMRLVWLVAMLIFATTTPVLFYTLLNYFSKLFYFFLEEKFELLLIKRRGEIDVATHEDPKQNDLFQKIADNGTWRIQNFVERQFYLLQNIIEVSIASIILLTASWWVFVILVVGTLPELVVEILYGRHVWGIHTSKAEIRRKFWDLRWHFYWLPSLIELKIFQNTRYFRSLLQELFRSFRSEEKVNERRRLTLLFFALVFSQGVIAFAVVWFILQVVQGNLLIGTLTFFLASIADLRQALSGFFSNIGRHYQDSLFITDVFRFVDIPPVIPRPKKGQVLSLRSTPAIVFNHVTFSYPGTERVVLKDFSLHIAPGEKIALVGANGAGKTTFVKLLCRFYDPDQGNIMVGGYDLKTVDLESWYR